MSDPGVFLDRMRGNLALALDAGASIEQVEAHVLAVIRKGSRPTPVDYIDASEVAELVKVLNEMRAHPLGGLA